MNGWYFVLGAILLIEMVVGTILLTSAFVGLIALVLGG